MGIGGILNTAANLAGAAGSGGSRGHGHPLKDFLASLSKHGVQIASNYDVEYTGFGGLQFYIQDISVPGLKSNVGQIFYKGRSIQVPVNAETEHEFTMTVICDADGMTYTKFRSLMLDLFSDPKSRKMTKGDKKDAVKAAKLEAAKNGNTLSKKDKKDVKKGDVTVNNRTIENNDKLIIKPRGDGVNNSGMVITMMGIRFTQISGLNFGNTRNEILTFTVNGYANHVAFQRTETSTSGGIMGGLGKVSSAIGNLTGR